MKRLDASGDETEEPMSDDYGNDDCQDCLESVERNDSLCRKHEREAEIEREAEAEAAWWAPNGRGSILLGSENVVQFVDYTPHNAGWCSCGNCGHRWMGVAPARRDEGGLREDGGLECPSCGQMMGEFEHPLLCEGDASCCYSYRPCGCRCHDEEVES